MEFQCGTPFVAEPPPMRQHFFLLWFPGLLDLQPRGKLFLKFFTEPRPEFETRLPPGSLAASHRGFAFCVADPIGSAHESTQIDIDGFALESGALRRLGERGRTRPPSLCYGAASRARPSSNSWQLGN